MNGLTYTKVGDYYLPNLVLKEQPDTPIGKYGRMRLRYLKEHRKGLYTSLLLTEKLYPICWRLTRQPMSEWIFLCRS